MPAERPKAVRVSLRRARIAARLPRAAVTIAGILLALAGLRGAVAPPRLPAPVPARAAAEGPDPVAARAFAEGFVRAYLTWHQGDRQAREHDLRPYLAQDSDPDAGLQPPSRGSQRVTWTAAETVDPLPGGRLLVTVAAATDHDDRPQRLAVTIARRGDALAIAEPPAIAAAPRRAAPLEIDEPPLTDQALADVAARALENWLAGNADNLRADLAPGAEVAAPHPRARLDGVEALTWVRAGRLLAVTAPVVGRLGEHARMRFLLTVERHGRWFVRSISDPQTQFKEQPR